MMKKVIPIILFTVSAILLSACGRKEELYEITDICLDAGFESQRTFNRVSRERYKVMSREYQNLYREQYLSQTQDEISGMEK